MLSVWNPFLPLTSAKSDNEISKRDLFDRIFHQTWNDFNDFTRPLSLSGINFLKTEEGLTISVDLPGVKDSDLVVNMDNNLIHIKAERKTQQSSYTINKSFSVPEGYSLDDIDAQLMDGILSLSFKSIKKPEKVIKQIEVKTPTALLNK